MSQALTGVMGLKLKWDECHKVFKCLHNLRENLGDSALGFRIQGFFAHTLIQLGVEILEINAQGHPDVVGKIENKRIKYEVEALMGKTRKRIIDGDDIEAIKPQSLNEKGYFGVLDCRLPPEWILVNYNRLKWRISESLSIVTLKSLSEKELSSKCTSQFYALILTNSERLSRLSFSILQERALKGEDL